MSWRMESWRIWNAMSKRQVKLGDVCQISWGDTTKTKSSYVENGFPAFSASGCDGFLPYFDHEGPGIVLSAIGARCGKTWFVDGKWSCIKNTIFIKTNTEIADPRYIYYQTKQPNLWPIRGAAQPFISQKDAQSVKIALPPLPTQRKIADILSAYDDLIENNLRRIRTLEDMAQSLYREWFVRFRFPCCAPSPPTPLPKGEGSEKEQGASHPPGRGGGEGRVKLVDSPLGKIPEGWEVKKLGDLCSDVRRGIPKGPLQEPAPYVGLEHIPRKSLALDDWDVVTELGSNKLLFEENEILFGKIRPYFHKVSVAPFNGICSADTIVIRSKRSEYRALVTACVSSEPFVAHATATSNGAKMPRANWKVLAKYPVLLPPRSLLAKFSIFFETVVEEQKSLIRRNQNLRQTRDLLLPKLLTPPADT